MLFKIICPLGRVLEAPHHVILRRFGYAQCYDGAAQKARPEENECPIKKKNFVLHNKPRRGRKRISQTNLLGGEFSRECRMHVRVKKKRGVDGFQRIRSAAKPVLKRNQTAAFKKLS